MVATLDDREGENSQRKWNIKWFSFFPIHGGRKKKKRGSPSILLSKFHPLRKKIETLKWRWVFFSFPTFFSPSSVSFFFCQNVTSLTWELTCYHLQELVLSSVSFPLPVRAQSTHPVFHFFGPSVCLSTAFSSYSHNIHCVRVHRWTGGRPPPFYCYDLFFFLPIPMDFWNAHLNTGQKQTDRQRTRLCTTVPNCIRLLFFFVRPCRQLTGVSVVPRTENADVKSPSLVWDFTFNASRLGAILLPIWNAIPTTTTKQQRAANNKLWFFFQRFTGVSLRAHWTIFWENYLSWECI